MHSTVSQSLDHHSTPRRDPPDSDGWKYSKIPGWEEFAMEFDDELTDEEEVSDDDDE